MAFQADGGDDDPTLSGDERILHRARQRFKRCQQWYDVAYKNSLDDTKFAHQDDRNHYGWPDKIYADRDNKRKPCLTINITGPHNRLVINESLQNKASIRVRGTGGRATADAAEGMQALVDRTENISAATIAYRTAITHQVNGGFGYLILETRFVDAKSFNQDVYVRAAPDPRAVYLDPDAERKTPDGSGAEFGFIFEAVSRDLFNREHRKWKDKVGTSTLGNDPLWISEKHVLVATYYERAAKNDELIAFTLDNGEQFVSNRSKMEEQSGKELVDRIIEQIDNGLIDGQYRDIITQDVNWYDIAGDCIIKRGDTDKTRWIGEYIPIIPMYGIKTVIEGKMDCAGMTRCLISPQQMLNYNASGQVQFGALQSRTPYVGPIKAFETNEKEWATANVEDYAYLGYDDWAEEEGQPGREVKGPTRQEPPQTAPVYMQGMQDAERWAMMVSGQWQQQQGQDNQLGPESGKAINARQRQGKIATYHFTEHQYDAYRYLGKQLIGIYPKLYDTKRILHVEGEDLTKRVIQIDPDATEALQRLKQETDTAEEIIFNPMVGEYEIVSDPGPNYATQRQQAWDAMADILKQNMDLVSIIGDQLFRNGDFAGAQEIADRMKKWIKATKPYLFDDEANPQTVELQTQMQKLVALNAELVTKLADEKLKVRGRDEKRDIEAFNAETKRMEAQIRVLTEVMLTPAQKAEYEHRLDAEFNQHVYNLIEATNQADLAQDAQPSESGASQ